jgi:hypothetical protein
MRIELPPQSKKLRGLWNLAIAVGGALGSWWCADTVELAVACAWITGAAYERGMTILFPRPLLSMTIWPRNRQTVHDERK